MGVFVFVFAHLRSSSARNVCCDVSLSLRSCARRMFSRYWYFDCVALRCVRDDVTSVIGSQVIKYFVPIRSHVYLGCDFISNMFWVFIAFWSLRVARIYAFAQVVLCAVHICAVHMRAVHMYAY